MGDSRHKKSPPTDPEEDVTPLFRRQAKNALKANKSFNKIRRLKKGDPGYLISNQAELAKALDDSRPPGERTGRGDNRMMSRILGPERPTTKVDLVERSAFVGPIRRLLNLPELVEIEVPASRAATLRLLAGMEDEDFLILEREAERIDSE